jgi:hypothetical protein
MIQDIIERGGMATAMTLGEVTGGFTNAEAGIAAHR